MLTGFFSKGTHSSFTEGTNKRLRINNFIISSFILIKGAFLIFYLSQGEFVFMGFKSISFVFSLFTLYMNHKGKLSFSRPATLLDMLGIFVLQIFIFGSHPFIYLFFILPIPVGFILYDVHEKRYAINYTILSIAIGALHPLIFNLYPHTIQFVKFDYEIYQLMNFITGGGMIGFCTYWLVHENNLTESKLKKSIQEAEEAVLVKSNFLSVMSHEIRTPLNGITGLAELLYLDSNGDKEKLNVLMNASQQLKLIVNDILDYSKIESGQLSISNKPFKVKHLYDQIESIYSKRALITGVNFNIAQHENLPEYLVGDFNRLVQIANNLLDNAFKFTESGSIDFMICYTNQEFHMVVIDTGIGIHEKEVEQIFNRFHQVDTYSTRKYEGTGLGLSICKLLCELQGGFIEIESEINKGSTFTVTLPYTAIYENPEAEKEESIERLEPSYLPKILYVEDNEINQFVTKQMLKILNCDFTICDTPENALLLLKKDKYDLILTDYHMPNINGLQLAKKIKYDLNNTNNTTPIVLLTADALTDFNENGEAHLFSDILFKPIKIEEVKEIVQALDKPTLEPAC